ncbi:hypothetical protein HPB48_002422 [Haemaphysalis longicornis]|uniref:G-protein coupled receptors family 1 profile domain-containing protein n=1 Tax=Haemaphysalis longicornis TaxID=44386 RepID=A0A9J6FEN9_HAELO|nr:hypothetical protein HPB48_002422 [Haemaphysalis longicornis]
MLATVVLMFAVCWLPIHLMNLIVYFDRAAMLPDTAEQEYLYIAAFFSCHWFSMANSFVNPIIYCFMSDNFRADVMQLILKRSLTGLDWTRTTKRWSQQPQQQQQQQQHKGLGATCSLNGSLPGAAISQR